MQSIVNLSPAKVDVNQSKDYRDNDVSDSRFGDALESSQHRQSNNKSRDAALEHSNARRLEQRRQDKLHSDQARTEQNRQEQVRSESRQAENKQLESRQTEQRNNEQRINEERAAKSRQTERTSTSDRKTDRPDDNAVDKSTSDIQSTSKDRKSFDEGPRDNKALKSSINQNELDEQKAKVNAESTETEIISLDLIDTTAEGAGDKNKSIQILDIIDKALKLTPDAKETTGVDGKAELINKLSNNQDSDVLDDEAQEIALDTSAIEDTLSTEELAKLANAAEKEFKSEKSEVNPELIVKQSISLEDVENTEGAESAKSADSAKGEDGDLTEVNKLSQLNIQNKERVLDTKEQTQHIIINGNNTDVSEADSEEALTRQNETTDAELKTSETTAKKIDVLSTPTLKVGEDLVNKADKSNVIHNAKQITKVEAVVDEITELTNKIDQKVDIKLTAQDINSIIASDKVKPIQLVRSGNDGAKLETTKNLNLDDVYKIAAAETEDSEQVAPLELKTSFTKDAGLSGAMAALRQQVANADSKPEKSSSKPDLSKMSQIDESSVSDELEMTPDFTEKVMDQIKVANLSESSVAAQTVLPQVSGTNQGQSSITSGSEQDILTAIQEMNKADNLVIKSTQSGQKILQDTINIIDNDFAANLRERISLMLGRKVQIADIRLDPPELGAMKVRLTIQNEQAQVNFVVQNPQAKEALEQAMPKLRELLEESGINLGESSVEQGSSNGQEELEGETNQSANQGQSLDEEVSDDENLNVKTSSSRNKVGSVDFYA